MARKRKHTADLVQDQDAGPRQPEVEVATSASPEDAYFMGLALEEARRAEDLGEVPIGCVIVDPSRAPAPCSLDDLDEMIVARGHNLTRSQRTPLGHAELVAIEAAAESAAYERLLGCTVYVTVEPCFMCAGALVHARVARVVWGIRDPKFGACVSLGQVLSDPRLNHRARLCEGVLAEESRELLVGFFRGRRSK